MQAHERPINQKPQRIKKIISSKFIFSLSNPFQSIERTNLPSLKVMFELFDFMLEALI